VPRSAAPQGCRNSGRYVLGGELLVLGVKVAASALLRSLAERAFGVNAGRSSDSAGEFGERRDDAESA
jgi:hypothetical protein